MPAGPDISAPLAPDGGVTHVCALLKLLPDDLSDCRFLPPGIRNFLLFQVLIGIRRELEKRQKLSNNLHC